MNDSRYNMKPQDVVVLFKMLAQRTNEWNQTSLSKELGISQSEISASIQRSMYSGLISSLDKSVNKKAFFEFIIYGLKYVFPQKPGHLVRGIPTAHSSPFLREHFDAEEHFVWPSGKGEARGQAIVPLYRTVPGATRLDGRLYLLLALADVIRVGRVREREMAIDILKEEFNYA